MDLSSTASPSVTQSAIRFSPALSRLICLVSILLFVTGCATTKSHSSVSNLKPGEDELKIVLMPVDVQLYILTAGGALEPQAEWTQAAEENMLKALDQIEDQRNGEFIVYEHPEILDEKGRTILEIERLHRAVGEAILFHKYQVPLPTKEEAFDWTLGPDVTILQNRTDADYALFIYVKDSYSSAGRVFVQAAAALLGVSVSGGQQIGFSSLVDLDTGDIVWFNYLFSPTGDLRTPEPALKTTELLLKDLPE